MYQRDLFSTVTQPIELNYPFQSEAIGNVLDEFKRGVGSTALIMATGTGKTRCFIQIGQEFIRRTAKPILILANQIELVEQTEDVLKKFGIEYAREQSASYALSKGKVNAVVACTKSMTKPERLKQFPPDYFSLIITDECHHAVCAENRKIYEYFSDTKHLGVTATPLRHDRIGLKNIYQSVAFQYPIQQGIEEGCLCQLKAKQVKVEGLELEKIKLNRNDFSKAELNDLLMREEILLKMVLPTIELAGDRPTIVFTKNIKHARAITDCFNRQTDKEIAVMVDSKMSDTDKRGKIELFKSGEMQFIINIGILTEGFDHPPTSCIALFRPTKSLGLLAQMIGRGTRIAEGKRDCLILDFVGVKNTVRTVNYLDVLDGTILSDEEHERAQKYIGEGENPVAALEKAKLEIAKIEALQLEYKALTKARAFDILKLFGVPSKKGLYGGEKASEYLGWRLKEKGIKNPEKLERGEAEALDAEFRRRSRSGLASFKQLTTLKKHYKGEFEPQTITISQAHYLISESCRANGKADLVHKFETKLGTSKLGDSWLYTGRLIIWRVVK